MKFSILSVILWPKRAGRLSPKIVEFREGMVNVITGESGAGKSSLTWIIDYCLGSGKCSIPVGHIRDTVDWFAIHVRARQAEFIVARRNPGEKESTSEAYLDPGPSPDRQKRPEKNTNTAALKDYLNRLAGLPALDFDGQRGGPKPFRERPSFRDLAAFNFQPQHIVANPFTLFFKADTTEHREKLKTIFPLVIGAIDADDMATQRELAEIEWDLQRLRADMSIRTAAVSRWLGNIRSFYDRAVALSLAEPIARPDWNVDQYVTLLAPLASRFSDGEPKPEPGRVEASSLRIAELAKLEDQLARDLGLMRRRMSGIHRFVTSARDYERNLEGQTDRFSALGWFEKAVINTPVCPVCHSENSTASVELKRIQRLATEMQSIATAVRATPTVLDKEFAELRAAVSEIEQRLSETRMQRRALEDTNEASAASRFKTTEIYRFIGRLQQALDSADLASPQGDLAQKIADLEQKARACRQRLDSDRRRERVEFALTKIATILQRYAKALKLEHADSDISLDFHELTLRFRNQDGRRDYLWEIGSGQNWVGYHIATILALHEWFSTLDACPVPGFILIDQPSQVYFPEAWPTVDSVPNIESVVNRDLSADIAGVQRIFEAVSDAVSRLSGGLQVIVTEHAGEITWQGLANVHVVGNWRKGHDEFLIPSEWIEQQRSGAIDPDQT